ncbi:MAG: histidine--tRNA ligase [Candidatus Bathyarchaeota archaeon]|nr:MAG: histidine--tRNA ligase [Candidatus Bathyarchaeota archaeon]
MTYNTIRGMRDFLPEDLAKRRFVENVIRDCFRLHGYEELETPTVESFELVAAKAGEEIRHRMYAFNDLGGRKVAIRPEMTASVARVVAGKLRTQIKPLRLGYLANCFRYDNPQQGRFREFWQAGFELFGSSHAEADAEIIVIFHELMKRLNFTHFTIKIGHVGILRELFKAENVVETEQQTIMNHLDKHHTNKALADLDALHVSDNCKTIVQQLLKLHGVDLSPIVNNAQTILEDYPAAFTALRNLEEIVRLSKAGGVTSPLLIDLGFARALEYYTGMIFEVFVPTLKIALGGGGRYDQLVELLGGEPTPAVGSAPGIDRIILAMEAAEHPFPKTAPTEVLVIPVGEALISQALEIAVPLRSQGISVQVELMRRGLKSALSYADKKTIPFTVIVGSEDMQRGLVTLRDMNAQTQQRVKKAQVVEVLKTQLKTN